MIKKIVSVSVFILYLASPFFYAPFSASAAIGSWQKGVTLDPRWTTDFGSDSFKQSVQNAAAAHANYVTLTIPIYQSNTSSIDLAPGWNTPTDDSLAAGIDYAHSLGLKVALKPHAESYDGQWRANINPGDRDGWFNAYGYWLDHFAKIGQAHGAEELVVGSELIDMSVPEVNPTNTAHWVDLIGKIRKVFSGALTYSANWGGSTWADEKNHIQFWSSLDYIGIAAYFSLNSDLSTAGLESQWDYWRTADIEPLHVRWGKPVLFTEIGYRSMNGAHSQPFNSWDHWGASEYEQSQLYTALFEYWNRYGYFAGVQLWQWSTDPNAGWPGDDNYTPQHKTAEGVMNTWFGSGAPPPASQPVFAFAGGAAPDPGLTGQQEILSLKATNGSSSVTNAIVDLEVRASADQKIFQQFWNGQSFASGEVKNYSANWTPGAAGTYVLKAGVFNSDWTQNYGWQAIKTFVVKAATSSPPVTCPAPAQGAFTGCYYDNQDFTGLTFSRTDSAVNFDWGAGSPDARIGADTFSVAWSGNFNFAAGQYNFTATTDDGMQVKVDGVAVIDKYFDQPATTYTAPVSLNAGTHKVEIRYFESGGGAVAKVSWALGGGPPPPPPPPASSTVNVWWPTDGATIRGTQPFKAMLENWDISNYDMFWQVDGDGLNPMANSTVDYPHKEAMVDVSGWSWKGSGPYNLNFVAKDKNGTMLNQKAVNIYVSP